MHELRIYKQNDKHQSDKCLPSTRTQSPIVGPSHRIGDTMSMHPLDLPIAGPSHVQSIDESMFVDLEDLFMSLPMNSLESTTVQQGGGEDSQPGRKMSFDNRSNQSENVNRNYIEGNREN